jgi:2-oxoisovalerate dehydrogenase E1 component
LIIHEDGITAGFGAEVAATVAESAFFYLDAPIQRLAIPDVPVPHNFGLMDAVVPTVESIAEKMNEVLEA